MAFAGKTQVFVNNQWTNAASGKTFDVVNPSTGQLLAKVAEGDAADIDAAVAAAEKAFQTWKKVPGEGRAALMHKLADLVSENIKQLAQLESLNNGTNLSATVPLMNLAAMWLRYYAGFADKLTGKTTSLVLGPALACGNTVVIKPSEKTPLTALFLAELIVKAGFPPGVVNVVPGFGPTAGASLARHMKVAKISFTGSVTTGRSILRDAANSNLKRVTLELGGKSPLIVCPDVDLTEAAERAHGALFYNNGQVCSAGSRVFVHESIYDAFVAKLVERAKKRLAAVGPSVDPKTELTPVVDALQFERVKSYIQAGVQDGATLAFGGRVIPREGYYLEPTIFTNVTDGMKIAREEIFGPVMAVIKYKTYEEALQRANSTEFGLGAGVLTKNISTALTLAHNIDSGSVWINTYGAVFPQTPFGGFKQSGIGRENGEYVLHEYMQVKTVTVGGLGLPKL